MSLLLPTPADKPAWRLWAAAQRRKLPLPEISTAIGQRLVAAKPTDVTTILAYSAKANELNLPLEKFYQAGVSVYLPVIQRNKHMVFQQWCPNRPMERNTYGITEPTTGSLWQNTGKPTWILLPCLAVTTQGHRLGYGGGYYDRWLATNTAPNLHTIACVPHALLLNEAWAIDSWDQPVHSIVTEHTWLQGVRR